ncbi:MAG: phage tail protein [Myxococcales bacterium]|nr:phage tail protein [Myxococcales bacterium]
MTDLKQPTVTDLKQPTVTDLKQPTVTDLIQSAARFSMASIQASNSSSTGQQTANASKSTVAASLSLSQGTFFALPAVAPMTFDLGAEVEEILAISAMDAPKAKAKGPAKATKPVKATPGQKQASSTAAKPNTAVGKAPPKAKTKQVPNMEPGKLDPVALKGSGSANSASTGEVGSPDVAYAFTIQMNGTTYGMFSEIGGVSWKAEPVPVRSGGNNEWAYNMRGPGKFEPLTLKRGWFASNSEFFQLLQQGLSGNSAPTAAGAGRFAMTINCLNRKYDVIGHYDFSDCFFVEYTGPGFNSMSGQVGFEQVRIAYNFFNYRLAS